MKYSIRINGNFISRYMDEANELIIKYKKRAFQVIEWVSNRPKEQRIVFDLLSYYNESLPTEDKDIFLEVFKIHPNIAFLIHYSDYKENPNFIQFLKENEIDFFFIEYADTWDKFYNFISCEVSDIYIANEFGFSLTDIYASGYVCNIRVYPNVAQTSAYNQDAIDDMTKFFIRPEDVNTYEPLVDYFEFYCPDKQQDTYYKIYALDGGWTSNLKFIIKSFNKDVISAQLPPEFGIQRAGCGKHCYHSGCSTCRKCLDTATLMNDLYIGLQKKKGISNVTIESDQEFLRKMSYIKESKEEEDKVRESLSDNESEG